MPRTLGETNTQNQEPQVLDLDFLKDFCAEHDKRLTFDFEMTHLDHITNVLNRSFNLDREELITSNELLMALYTDLSGPHFENKTAQKIIDKANTLNNCKSYDEFRDESERAIQYSNQVDRDVVADWGFGGAAIGGIVAFAMIGVASAISSTPLAIASVPTLLGMVACGLVMGVKRYKKLKAEAKENIEKEINKIPTDYATYKTAFNLLVEGQIKDFTQASDEHDALITLDQENPIERICFKHAKAPSVRF